MVAVQGGATRPKLPPSIFNIPTSSLPTPKPPPRKPKQEYAHQTFFDKNDKVFSFESFFPEKNMYKRYSNILQMRKENQITCFYE